MTATKTYSSVSTTLISCGGNIWYIFRIFLICILLLFKECHLTARPMTTTTSAAAAATTCIISRTSTHQHDTDGFAD
jgi:hypothetical protein